MLRRCYFPPLPVCVGALVYFGARITNRMRTTLRQSLSMAWESNQQPCYYMANLWALYQVRCANLKAGDNADCPDPVTFHRRHNSLNKEKAGTRGGSRWGSEGREGGYGRNEKPTHIHINVLHSTMAPSLKKERVNLQAAQKPHCPFKICRWSASAPRPPRSPSVPPEHPIKVPHTVLIMLVNREGPSIAKFGGKWLLGGPGEGGE